MGDQTAGCVLFADVSGSTKLYETVGDAQAHSAIELCVKLFSAFTLQHGGRVVKTIGDEVMAVFPDSPLAADAARDIQLSVQDMAPVGKVRLGVRIGFHYGVLVERDKTFLKPIVTEIAPAAEFHMAEAYHQEYFKRVGGGNPYCSFVIEPKVAKFRKQYMDRLKK